MNESISSSGGREKAENLIVRVALHRGEGVPDLYQETARELVEEAWVPPRRDRTPARGLFLFATADWCQDPSLPKVVRDAIREHSGYDVPLIGGSMAKLCCSKKEDPVENCVIDNGVVLVALYSQYFWMTVASLEKPHTLSDSDRAEAIKELTGNLEREADVRLGYSAERYVMGMFPGIFRDERGPKYRDNELHHEILMAFRNQRHIFGGGAANHFQPDKGYQFANDKCLESSLALALVESDMSTGAMIGHGFVVREESPRVSVDGFADGDNSGYEIALLDGKSAQERIQELKQQEIVLLDRPIFGLPCGSDQHVIVPLTDYVGHPGAVRVNRKLARGDRLYILMATADQMMRAGSEVFRSACRDAGGRSGTPDDWLLILAFCCSGRFEEYEARGMAWEDAVIRLFSEYPGVSIVGGLCSGEFGTDSWRRARANNMSISTCCVTGKWAGRSESRRLQIDLLRAAERLSACQTPRDVMETALDCAVDAGAAGGQICIVDHKIGRILGLHLGVALQPEGSPYNWPAVIGITNRKYSPEKGGLFPAHLLEWAIPMQDVDLAIVPHLPRWEDSLTLVVRTRQAIFVPNSWDTEHFFQDWEAVNVGNLSKQLVIPLVGSHDNVIATLQLSLRCSPKRRDKLLNRGSFRLWIGFAYKLASALERAQEAEERGILERMSATGNQIMMTPVGELSPDKQYDWCNEYLMKLIEELGADGAHMRLFYQTVGGEEYELIGAVGHLADLLRATRQVTREGDGGCSRAAAEQGGLVANTREETDGLHLGVRPVAIPERRDAMQCELAQIQSLMSRPLRGQGKVIGSFVVHSKQSFFFTERWQRIVEQAAERAGSLFLGKKADYERAFMDRGRQWMLQAIVASPQDPAQTQLRRVLTLACNAVSADVASVFVWHSAPQRLVLHTAHNWAEPEGQEGQASYRLGEGWTGKLAEGPDIVLTVNPTESKDPHCTRTYYHLMISPEHQFRPEEGDARAGIRLAIGDNLVGVAVFHYYKDHASRLVDDVENIKSRLWALEELLTPSVQAVRQEAAHRLSRQLTRTEEIIWHELIQATEPGANWQEVMGAVRVGFEVERASLYYAVDGRRIRHGWTSPVSQIPVSAPAVLGGSVPENILSGKINEAVFDEPEAISAEFPQSRGIRFLYLAAVISPAGERNGILELVNRTLTPEHPYELLNSDECAVARDVARTLGAAISIQTNEVWRDQLGRQLAAAMEMGAALLTSTGVMHELKTPFAEIQAAVDWLKLHPQCSEQELKECLDEILGSCRKARQVIREAADQRKADTKLVDLGLIVEESARLVRLQVPPMGIEFRVNNDLRIGVFAQPLQIKLAVVNLLRNALEAVKDGGNVSVDTEMTLDKKFAIVRVYNTGRHFSEDEIDAFFTIGYTSKGGMGYGMAIARQTVESAGGSLQVYSPPEGGIEARVMIPCEKQSFAEQMKDNGDQV